MFYDYNRYIANSKMIENDMGNEENPVIIYDNPSRMWKDILAIMYDVSIYDKKSVNSAYKKISEILDNNSLIINESIKKKTKSYYNVINKVVRMYTFSSEDSLNLLSKLGCDGFISDKWKSIFGDDEYTIIMSNVFSLGYKGVYEYFNDRIEGSIFEPAKDIFKGVISTSLSKNICSGSVNCIEDTMYIINKFLTCDDNEVKLMLNDLGFSEEKMGLNRIVYNDVGLFKYKDLSNKNVVYSTNEEVLFGIVLNYFTNIMPEMDKKIEGVLMNYLSNTEKKHIIEDLGYTEDIIKSKDRLRM